MSMKRGQERSRGDVFSLPERSQDMIVAVHYTLDHRKSQDGCMEGASSAFEKQVSNRPYVMAISVVDDGKP